MEYIGAIIIAHLWGDYILQNQWLSDNKVKNIWAATLHGVLYTLPFLFITLNIWSLLIICVTHIFIDRYRLAKYVVWLKNNISPERYSWNSIDIDQATGFPKYVPAWMRVWLMIIVDNSIHLVINILAIVLFL